MHILGPMLDIERTIREAEGFALIGLHTDAWRVIETLPASERLRAEVLAVRLYICAGLPAFEMGREIAKLVGPGSPDNLREAAGRFRLADAVALLAVSDKEGARSAIFALAVVWPEGREVALNDHRLAGMW